MCTTYYYYLFITFPLTKLAAYTNFSINSIIVLVYFCRTNRNSSISRQFYRKLNTFSVFFSRTFEWKDALLAVDCFTCYVKESNTFYSGLVLNWSLLFWLSCWGKYLSKKASYRPISLSIQWARSLQQTSRFLLEMHISALCHSYHPS